MLRRDVLKAIAVFCITPTAAKLLRAESVTQRAIVQEGEGSVRDTVRPLPNGYFPVKVRGLWVVDTGTVNVLWGGGKSSLMRVHAGTVLPVAAVGVVPGLRYARVVGLV